MQNLTCSGEEQQNTAPRETQWLPVVVGSILQYFQDELLAKAKSLWGTGRTAPRNLGPPKVPRIWLREVQGEAQAAAPLSTSIPAKVSTARKNPAVRWKEESWHGFLSFPFMSGVAAGVPGSDLPPQAGHAVHGHAAAGVFAELGLQQVEPIFHYLAGRRRSIIERPILQGGGKREILSDPGEKNLRGLLFTQGDGVWDLGSGEVDACARNWAQSAAPRGCSRFCGTVWHAGIPWLLQLRVCSHTSLGLGSSLLLWTGSAFRSTYGTCNTVPVSCLCRTRVAIACLLPIRMTALSFGELQVPSFPLPAPV